MTLKVKWKLDDGAIQTSAWMPGMKAIGPMGRNAQVWLRDIAKGKKLVVQVPDRHGGQEAVFDITGIDVIGPRFSEVDCGR